MSDRPMTFIVDEPGQPSRRLSAEQVKAEFLLESDDILRLYMGETLWYKETAVYLEDPNA